MKKVRSPTNAESALIRRIPRYNISTIVHLDML